MTGFCPECYQRRGAGHTPTCSGARVLPATACRVPGCHAQQDPGRRLPALCAYHGRIQDDRLRRMAAPGEEQR